MGLNWESTYEVALALDAPTPAWTCGRHPGSVFAWIMALPDFEDEAALCNDEILQSIFQEWYEVSINA